MSPAMSLQEVIAAGESLPPDDRYRVAMSLLASLEPIQGVVAVEKQALKWDLTRRIQEIESGEVELLTAEEVIANLRRQNEARRL